MEEIFWTLLDRIVEATKARARTRGLPVPRSTQIFGAILSSFLLGHHEELLAEQTDVEIEEIRKYLGKYFTPSELAVLGSTEVSPTGGNSASSDVQASARNSNDE